LPFINQPVAFIAPIILWPCWYPVPANAGKFKLLHHHIGSSQHVYSTQYSNENTRPNKHLQACIDMHRKAHEISMQVGNTSIAQSVSDCETTAFREEFSIA
jgi:hypothetical protein